MEGQLVGTSVSGDVSQSVLEGVKEPVLAPEWRRRDHDGEGCESQRERRRGQGRGGGSGRLKD